MNHSTKGKRDLPCMVAIGLLGFHVVRCLFLFDPASGVVGRDPMVLGDYSLHFACGVIGAQHWSNTGRFWGYDPSFMAGWLDPPAVASNFPIKVLFSAIRNPDLWAPALRIFVYVSCALGPVLFALACRAFGLRRWSFLLAVALGIAYWWIGPPYRMVKWGMFLYTFCAYGAVYVHGLYVSLLRCPSLGRCLAAAFGVLACFFIHGAAAFLLCTPMLVLTLMYGRTRWKWIALLGATSGLGLLYIGYNIYFMTWLFVKRFYILSTDFALGVGGDFHLLGPLLDLVRYRAVINAPEEAGRAFIELFLYLLFLHWLWRKRGKGYTGLEISLVLAAGVCFVLSFYSSWIPLLKGLQLFRMKTSLFLYLIPLGSMSISHLFRERDPCASWRGRVLTALLFAPLCVSLWYVPGVWIHWRPIDGRIPEQGRELLDWVRQHVEEDGRLLIEESGYLDDEGTGTLKYFGGYFPALIPFMTGKEIMGGPHPYMGGLLPGPVHIIPSGHASFVDGYLFRKDVTEISRDYLENMLDLYNVRWIISWSRRAYRFFETNPDLVKPLGRLGNFDLYEVRREGNYFLKGNGICRAEADRIHLSQIRSDEGEIILSYHWFDVLETDPPCHMDGIFQSVHGMDDPLPFVRVQNPPAELVIQVKGYRKKR